MAIDHFEKYKIQIGRTDWNFNFLFDAQPQVSELASKYTPLLDHPGLYKPIPAQWLHATVLRVGFVDDFTETEMLAVADKVEPLLANLRMPQLILGRRCRLWNGGPFLTITPHKHLQKVYGYLLDCLTEVVGRDRLPVIDIALSQQKGRIFVNILNKIAAIIGRDRLPAKLQFLPHITLAYPKAYDDERGLHKRLKAHPINGIPVRINSISLIRQWPIDDHYEWEIVKSLPIG